MRTSLRTFAASAALLASLALVPTVGFAAELRGGNQTTVGKSEIINNDLYIAGSSVTSAGTIQGTLTTAGGTVLVTGSVSGDVNAAGGTLTLLGNVGGSLRVAGGNVTIGGPVQNDIVAAGGQIQITGGQVGRDVVVTGGTLRIDSPVMGNVRFMGGDLYINAPVAGNIEADAGKVTLGGAAVISGNLNYKAPQRVVMETGARVNGTVTYTPKASQGDFSKGALVGFVTFWIIAKLLMLLAGALIFGLILRRFTTEVVKKAFAEPLTEMGRGLVVLIVLPIVSVLLCITVIGIPFGVLGLLGFVGGIIVSSIAAPILLGSLLYKWMKKSASYEVTWSSIALGVAAYFVCGLIPVIGWFVAFGFWLAAMGAIAKIKMGEMQAWR